MRKIDAIIIHCSDTPNGRHNTVEDIDKWHRERGFSRSKPVGNPGLKAIGYHYVIYVDGSVHTGRDISEVGAHAQGCNANTIGICMVGRGGYTQAQWDSLHDLVNNLRAQFKTISSVIGHCSVSQKSCPNFNVGKWLAAGMRPGADQVLPA